MLIAVTKLEENSPLRTEFLAEWYAHNFSALFFTRVFLLSFFLARSFRPRSHRFSSLVRRYPCPRWHTGHWHTVVIFTVHNVSGVFFRIFNEPFWRIHAVCRSCRYGFIYEKFSWSNFLLERIFEIMDKRPRIPVEGGIELNSVKGEILIKDVSFTYPTRPDTQVLTVRWFFPDFLSDFLVPFFAKFSLANFLI